MSERERLAWAVDLIAGWQQEYEGNEVLDAFLHLDRLDRTRNQDLWEELRLALAGNEELDAPDLHRFLQDKELAAAGHWWYDPDQWTLVGA